MHIIKHLVWILFWGESLCIIIRVHREWCNNNDLCLPACVQGQAVIVFYHYFPATCVKVSLKRLFLLFASKKDKKDIQYEDDDIPFLLRIVPVSCVCIISC